jgi:RNA polymerase sigma-70 factor (ECF subfamily)
MMQNTATDAVTQEGPMQRDLVVRAMAHDHEAFTELVRLSIDKLYAIARLILFDADRAQDATQETLILAWRDIAAIRDPDRFEAWLRRLLVNACYREAKRARKRWTMEKDVIRVDPGTPDTSQPVATRDELERGFQRLDPDQRIILVLHYYVGLPLQDTADALGLPIGTVKSRLHRATHALRARLDADSRPGLPLEQTT